MIIEEEKKEKEKNEIILADLCECCLSLNFGYQTKFISTCVPCLLKVSLNKEENEEAQKEVEMALLALSNIKPIHNVLKDLYLNEIKEIIKHHQEHHNLTRLAYQSVWQFLIYRFFNDKSLNDIVVNELQFVGEARRELEELTKRVDWKKKKEEEKRKKAKEEFVLMRWLHTLAIYFSCCRLKNEEFAGLIGGVVQVYRAAKGNNEEIVRECVFAFKTAAENKSVKVEDLLKGGAVDAVLEEMQRPKLDDKIAFYSLKFFTNISNRLEEKKKEEMEEEERKITKRKVFEEMEEEGYKDVITCFHEIIDFLNKRNYHKLSMNISDYLVNV
eukprot:MONOS_12605.1-p1 / transcript=MONOS_12605.1 / gene=MONOS_12605 / organism=Monocercomonoides_exilis_PA203 / gene_product=unspecified product / transcript_product=unspecified product / location=Mono_scaffold00708:15441-16478(+) / protein_length=329 / sequence_SO=supercontig / SO=protein_coding / is_pseudo=false